HLRIGSDFGGRGGDRHCRGAAGAGRGSTARIWIAAISGGGNFSNSKINSGGGGTDRFARESGGIFSGPRAFVHFDLCHQQAIVWLDDSVPLASSYSGELADWSVFGHDSRWLVSGARCSTPQSH